mmetsp:Transcript_4465/g.13982  ORF Transcript_4465/g.13982 Transcript_4465/m.13982 type:complete len:228 (-) Transcript_4465:18-701(-)
MSLDAGLVAHGNGRDEGLVGAQHGLVDFFAVDSRNADEIRRFREPCAPLRKDFRRVVRPVLLETVAQALPHERVDLVVAALLSHDFDQILIRERLVRRRLRQIRHHELGCSRRHATPRRARRRLEAGAAQRGQREQAEPATRCHHRQQRPLPAQDGAPRGVGTRTSTTREGDGDGGRRSRRRRGTAPLAEDERDGAARGGGDGDGGAGGGGRRGRWRRRTARPPRGG